ncbi:MAG: twitching motility protein PilT [Micrococcales bacterium]|nr:twitching motility protein PilT [Micrococcales bacterium]MCL2666682.1 twitching motility protein PilT [Micrococcales bacterium]
MSAAVVGPHSILLDCTALALQADEHDQEMLRWSKVAHATGSSLYVSAVTLAEATDGSLRDANVRRELKAMTVEPVSELVGLLAGQRRAVAASARRKARSLTVDAVVAATAMTLPKPVVVLTGDPGDLELLLDGTGIKVRQVG